MLRATDAGTDAGDADGTEGLDLLQPIPARLGLDDIKAALLNMIGHRKDPRADRGRRTAKADQVRAATTQI